MNIIAGYISHVRIDKTLFGVVEYIDVEQQHRLGNQNYKYDPQAIVFDINNDDETADYAVIRGYLRGSSLVCDWTLRCGELHFLSFMRIYAAGTNARGIKILG